MALIYVFSEEDLDKALRAYVKEATDAYPDSAPLIHLVNEAMRDFMQSEFAAKFVTGESRAGVDNFGAPMPAPAEMPASLRRPQTELPLSEDPPKADSAPAILSWDDDN